MDDNIAVASIEKSDEVYELYDGPITNQSQYQDEIYEDLNNDSTEQANSKLTSQIVTEQHGDEEGSGKCDLALHRAAQNGDVSLLQDLCDKMIVTQHFDTTDSWLKRKDHWGRTALHYAKDVPCAKILMESAFIINRAEIIACCDHKGMTVAHYAAKGANADLLEYFLSLDLNNNYRRADGEKAYYLPESSILFMKDNDGRSLLHLSAHSEIVKVIGQFAADDSIYTEADNNGQTAFDLAIYDNLVNVEDFLHAQAFLASRDAGSISLIHEAVKSNNISIVRYLCKLSKQQQYPMNKEFSSDKNEYSTVNWNAKSLIQRDHLQRTVFHYVRKTEIAQLLAESIESSDLAEVLYAADISENSVLHSAVINDEIGDVAEYICTLIMVVPPPEFFNGDENTQRLFMNRSDLQTNLSNNMLNQRLFQFLIMKNAEGRTALHIASANGNEEFVQLISSITPFSDLLLELHDHKGCTPLHIAKNRHVAESIINSVKEISKFSLMEATNNKKRTVLHLIAEDGRTDILKYFKTQNLLHDSLLHEQDIDGKTPLHCISTDRAAKILLSSSSPLTCGNLVQIADSSGGTALHYAVSSYVAKLLAESVVDSSRESFFCATDKHHHTPLHKAVIHKRKDVVKYLCSTSASPTKLLGLEDKIYGRTALHYVRDEEVAKSMFDIPEDSQKCKCNHSPNLDELCHDHYQEMVGVWGQECDKLTCVRYKIRYILMSDKKGKTILYIAAKRKLSKLVKYLCSHLSHIQRWWTLSDKSGNTVLDYAVATKNLSMFNIIIDMIPAACLDTAIQTSMEFLPSLLFDAVSNDMSSVIRDIGINGRLIDLFQSRDSCGRSLIHVARTAHAMEELLKNIEWSKRIGYISQTKDRYGATALHSASAMGRTDVVEYLCNLLSSDDFWILCQKDVHGKAALCYAANNDIFCLLSEGFSPLSKMDAIEPVGSLNEAARDDRVDVFMYLEDLPLSYYMILMKPDENGQTPLHCAASSQVCNSILKVLSSTASEFILIGDGKKRTVLHTAIMRSCTDVVALLTELFPLEKSSLFLKVDHRQRNILHYASKDTLIAQYILDATNQSFTITEEDSDGSLESKVTSTSKELLFSQDDLGKTPLHYVKTVAVVRLFLESADAHSTQGSLLLVVDKRNRTPLHIFASTGLVDIVTYVCDYMHYHRDYRSVFLKDSDGLLPLNHALKVMCFPIIERFLTIFIDNVEYWFWIGDFVENELMQKFFHETASDGEVGIMQLLFNSAYESHLSDLLNGVDEFGKSVLHKVKDRPMAQLVLNVADSIGIVFTCDNTGNSVLHDAARDGRAGVLKYLLESDLVSQLCLVNNDGKSLLHVVKNKSSAIIIVEASNRIGHTFQSDNKSNSVLHDAAADGRVDVLEYLLDSQYTAELSNVNEFGESVLHVASHANVAAHIIDNIKEGEIESFLGVQDIYGQTALHMAAEAGNSDVVAFICKIYLPDDSLILQKDAKGRTALHYAADGDIAQILLSSISVDNTHYLASLQDENQMTALHTAVITERLSVVERLCQKSIFTQCMIKLQDLEGKTALFHAECENMIHILLNSVNPSNVQDILSLRNHSGQTVLYHVARFFNPQILEYLLKNFTIEVQWLCCDEESGNILHATQSPQMVKILFQYMRQDGLIELLMTCDKYGSTPLHQAVRRGRHEVIQALLSAGSRVESNFIFCKENEGMTALHYARNENVIKMLLLAVKPELRGAFLVASDMHGKTALHAAVECGRKEVVRFLCNVDRLIQEDEIHAITIHEDDLFQLKSTIGQMKHCNNLDLEPSRTIYQNDPNSTDATLSNSEQKIAEQKNSHYANMSSSTNLITHHIDECSRSALHYAKDREMAKIILDSVEINCRDEYLSHVDNEKKTVLHVAAEANRVDILEFICSITPFNEALLLQQDKYSKIALSYAKSDKAVQVLVGHFAPLTKQLVITPDENVGKLDILLRASKEGITNLMQYLVEIPFISHLIGKTDQFGRNIFHHARNRSIAELIVNKFGKDLLIEQNAADGQIPLHHASKMGNTDAVEFYLEQSPVSCTLMRDKYRRTPLHYARNADIARLILNTTEDDSELVLAREGLCDQTALHIASARGYSDVVRYLVEHYHASDIVHQRDRVGKIPLHYATNRDIAENLMQFSMQGIQCLSEFKDYEHQHTPFHSAIVSNNIEVVECYLSSQSGPHLWAQVDTNGKTALHLAESVDVAKVLFDHIPTHDKEEYLHLHNHQKQTPLHTACLNYRFKVAQYFISVAETPNKLLWHKDAHGRTVLYYAHDLKTIYHIIDAGLGQEQADYILHDSGSLPFDAVISAAVATKYDVVNLLVNTLLPGSIVMLQKGTSGLEITKSTNDIEDDDDGYHNKLRSSKQYFCYVKPLTNTILLVEKTNNISKLTYIASIGLTQEKIQKFLAHAPDSCDTEESHKISNNITACICKVDPSKLTKHANTPVLPAQPSRDRSLIKLLSEITKGPVTQNIVFSVSSDSKAKVLHQAIKNRSVELVYYILSMTDDYDALLTERDNHGKIALHYVEDVELMKVLLSKSKVDRRESYLLISDSMSGKNCLHIASSNGNSGVTTFILSNITSAESLLAKDSHGNTALHHACTAEVTFSLINFCTDEAMSLKLLFAVNDARHTVLHSTACNGRTGVVEALNSYSMYWEELCAQVDLEGRTALHYVSTDTIVELIANGHSDEYAKLLHRTDNSGKTALHYTNSARVAEALLASAHDPLEYVTIEDCSGYTGLTNAMRLGKMEVVEAILKYFDDSELSLLLRKENRFKQNAYHLACLSNFMDEILALLDDIREPHVDELISLDQYGNTVLSYAISKFNSSIFANFVIRLPLSIRKKVMNLKNIRNINIRAIINTRKFSSVYYVSSVLCEEEAAKRIYGDTCFEIDRKYARLPDGSYRCHLDYSIQFSEDIFKILHYALNEYSLTEPSFVLSHTLGQSAVAALIEPQLLQSVRNSSALWLFIDLDLQLQSRQMWQAEVNKLNTADFHGQPKVVVVQSTVDNKVYLIPPGPDYVIVTALFKQVGKRCFSDSEPPLETVEQLLDVLKRDENIEYIEVNSTLGRAYGEVREYVTIEDRPASTGYKGRALICCNTLERDGWEAELADAKTVLAQQIGLQVTEVFDQPVREMLDTISEFAHSDDHGAAVALAIMTHGHTDTGGIRGGDFHSWCSVQDVIKSLCIPELNDVPKMIFLSCCRGKLKPVNRAGGSWECKTEMIEWTSETSPVLEEISQQQFESEWAQHSFPPLQVPDNCHVCFSTLPDSLSLRGKMFRVFSDHLKELYDASMILNNSPSSSSSSLLALPECNNSTSESANASTLNSSTDTLTSTTTHFPKAELVSLITDAAGVLREKSRFKQYMHHTYTITKHTKPVILEVFPIDLKSS